MLSASILETCLAENKRVWNCFLIEHSTFSFWEREHLDKLQISQQRDLGILLMNKEDGMMPPEAWNAGQQVCSKTNVMYNICIRLVSFSYAVRVLPSKDAETCRILKLSDVVSKSPGSTASMLCEVATSNSPSPRDYAAPIMWTTECISIDCTGGSNVLGLRNSPSHQPQISSNLMCWNVGGDLLDPLWKNFLLNSKPVWDSDPTKHWASQTAAFMNFMKFLNPQPLFQTDFSTFITYGSEMKANWH